MDHLDPQITVERTPGPGMTSEHLTPQHLALKNALRDGTDIYIAPRAGRAKKARIGVTLVPDKYRNRHWSTPDRMHYELVVNYQDAQVNKLVANELLRVLTSMDGVSDLTHCLGKRMDTPDCLRFSVRS